MEMTQEIYDKIISLQRTYAENKEKIANLKTHNDQLESIIHNLHLEVKAIKIELTKPPVEDLTKGERCWICKRPSYYRCFWCYNDNRPCGYCDNHTHKHKIQFPDHIALYQRVFQIVKNSHWTDALPKTKETPEQIIARLEAELNRIRAKNNG